jgi:hypothetical protein
MEIMIELSEAELDAVSGGKASRVPDRGGEVVAQSRLPDTGGEVIKAPGFVLPSGVWHFKRPPI